MYCLIDNKKKIVFWYSAKSGCTFIKHLFCLLTDTPIPAELKSVHYMDNSYGKYDPEFLNNYTNLLFIRNPFKRIISGYLDKYCHVKYYTLEHIQDLNFKKFVDELYVNGTKNIDEHHFTLQFSEEYNEDLDTKFNKVFDIENVDYDYIFDLYQKRINIQEVPRGPHCVPQKNIVPEAFKLSIPDVVTAMPQYVCFFNDEIKNLIRTIYKKDFEKMKAFGFTYDI